MMKHIQRTVWLSALLLWMLAVTAGASIARPGWFDFTQPDGSSVRIRLIGDEFVHYAVSEDGYSLLYDKEGFLVYAVPDSSGGMVPSSLRVTGKSMQKSLKAVSKSDIPKGLVFSAGQVRLAHEAWHVKRKTAVRLTKSLQGGTAGTVKPAVVGDREILVILMGYADKAFSKTKEDFEMLMNQKGYSEDGAQGSVADFYEEASYGQLHLHITVVGPYTASRPLKYYGGDFQNARDLIKEAVAAADPEVDFNRFDNDGDGVVDCVHVVFAGYGGDAGASADCIWPHKGEIDTAADGVQVKPYSCSSEFRDNSGGGISRIGTVCHEMGHVFGCMDYYDTDYSSNGQYEGTGEWDIMASGTYNNAEITPPHFNPYVECYDFGWIQPVVLDRPDTVSIMAGEPKVFRIDSKEAGEYFLLENRQQQGFDSYIPRHGLMIYRVRTDSDGVVVGSSDDIINISHPQNCYPVCAGSDKALPSAGQASYGDINSQECPFPGSTGKTEFCDNTTPGARSWSSVELLKRIHNIAEDADGTVSFILDADDRNSFSRFYDAGHTASSVSLCWKTDSTGRQVVLAAGLQGISERLENREYRVGDVLPASGATVVYAGDAETFNHTGLDKDTWYHYRLYARQPDMPRWSSGVQLSVKTGKGKVTAFPYHWDFSDTDDRQQILQGETRWNCSSGITDWIDYAATWTPGKSTFQSTRLVSLPIDLSQARCAVLTLERRQFAYETLEIACRKDSLSPWQTLKVLSDTAQDFRPCTIAVPVGDSLMQIGLRAVHDVSLSGSSLSYGYMSPKASSMTVRRLTVDTDFSAFPVTESIAEVTPTCAKVSIGVLAGTGTVRHAGLAYTDGTDTLFVEAQEDSRTVILTNLKQGVRYACCTRVTTEAGDCYGNWLHFTTPSWAEGKGTAENPFPVRSEADLRMLADNVAAGMDYRNCHFRLACDIAMTEPFTGIGFCGNKDTGWMQIPFNGHFDGGHKTVSGLDLQDGSSGQAAGTGLFNCIGEWGVVRDLTVGPTDTLRTVAGYVACYNRGTVTGCRTSETRVTVECISAAGLVLMNGGFLTDCANRISFYTQNGNVTLGGIVNTNTGYTGRCTNFGSMRAKSGCTLGGIAVSNEKGHLSLRQFADIEDCANEGNLQADGDNPNFCKMGGIIGQNKGRTTGCANRGDITLLGNLLEYNNIGGVAGSVDDYAVIRDCYNTGDIHLQATDEGSVSNKVGGICGYSLTALLNRCYTTGMINTAGAVKAQPVAGNSTGVCKDCFYLDGCCESLSDVGTAVDDAGFFSVYESFIRTEEGHRLWRWDESVRRPVLRTTAGPLARGCLSAAGRTSATLRVAADTVLTSCFLEYKEEDTDNVSHSIPVKEPENAAVTLTGLQAKTAYAYRVVWNGGETEWEAFATLFPEAGSEAEPYLIERRANLRALALLSDMGMSFENGFFLQTRSFDLHTDSLHPWEPIDGLNAFTYDGGGHTLTNLYVRGDCLYAGLFGWCDMLSEIKNLTIAGHNVIDAPSSIAAGGLIGYGYLVLSRVLFSGDVTGGSYTGGLCGNAIYNSIYNSAYRGRLHGAGTIGGLANAGNYSIETSGTYCVVVADDSGIPEDSVLNATISSTRTYYQTGAFTGCNIGTPLTAEQMLDAGFPTLLNDSNEVWTADDAEHPVNGGYPVLTTMAPFAVETTGTAMTADTVTLRGAYLPGLHACTAFGFIYRNEANGNTGEAAASACDASLHFAATLTGLPAGTYVFQAFADGADGRISGEEKTFRVTSPTAVTETRPSSSSVRYIQSTRTIRVNSAAVVSRLTVIGLQGVTVMKATPQMAAFDISAALPDGVYIVELQTTEGTRHETIVVAH